MTESSGMTAGSGRRQRRLDKKLMVLLLVPATMGSIQLIIALVEISRGVSPVRGLLLLIPALVIGYPFGRHTRVERNEETEDIRMAGGQTALTIAFFALILVQRFVLKHALGSLENIGTIVLIVTAGIIFGRLLGMYEQLRDLLTRESR